MQLLSKITPTTKSNKFKTYIFLKHNSIKKESRMNFHEVILSKSQINHKVLQALNFKQKVLQQI